MSDEIPPGYCLVSIEDLATLYSKQARGGNITIRTNGLVRGRIGLAPGRQTFKLAEFGCEQPYYIDVEIL